MSLSHVLRRCVSTQVGTIFSTKRVFTAADVQTFGDLVDDHNSVHFSDEKAAATGLFKGRIAHGMLVSSVFSHLLAKHFPGAIYMGQTLKFMKPVYLGEEVEGKAVIRSTVHTSKGTKCVLVTTVTRLEEESVAVEGEATILILGPH